MTDAREIIALAAEDKLKFDGFSSYDEMAEHLMRSLTATGFRILGPDEVDPVTVEKCAELAECHSDDRPRRYSMDWNDGYIDGCRGAAAAIHALTEKRHE